MSMKEQLANKNLDNNLDFSKFTINRKSQPISGRDKRLLINAYCTI
jgi:hypothetical protein